jgi:hypothetical protein
MQSKNGNFPKFFPDLLFRAPEYSKNRPGRPFFLIGINPEKRYTTANSIDLEKGTKFPRNFLIPQLSILQI